MFGATISGKHLLQLRDFRPADELAVIEHPFGRDIDRFAEPAALRADIDKGHGFWGHLVHGAFGDLEAEYQPTTRRGPLRAAEAAGVAGLTRHWIAISRLATPSSPVTAGAPPGGPPPREKDNSGRKGWAWPAAPGGPRETSPPAATARHPGLAASH